MSLAVAIRSRHGDPRISVALRSDGHIESRREGGIGLSHGGRDVASVSALLIGYVNAGTQRVDAGATEDPIVVTLKPTSDGELAPRILDVDEGPGKKVGEHSVALDVEKLHGGERRLVRVQHTGPARPKIEITGAIKGQRTAIESFHDRRPRPETVTSAINYLRLAFVLLVFLVLLMFAFFDFDLFGLRRFVVVSTQQIEADQIDEIAKIAGDRVRTFHSPQISERFDAGPYWVGLMAVVLVFSGYRSLGPWIREYLVKLGLASPYPFDDRQLRDF